MSAKPQNLKPPVFSDISHLAQNGFAILNDVFTQDEIRQFIGIMSDIGEGEGVRTRTGIYAIRNLLRIEPRLADLARTKRLLDLVHQNLARPAAPVSGLFFDKTPDANWLVPWHQDLTICVRDRKDVEGYGPWTVKAGVHHVQPPASVLEGMLSVRIHLDDCAANNGALRVLPGTHHGGRLTTDQIEGCKTDIDPYVCETRAGGVVLMKPLVLHASSPAATPAHRRVIHIDYSSAPLAGGLKWAD